MFSNSKPSERAAVVGVIDPDAYATNPYSTGWVDAAKFRSFMAIVCAGDLGSSATINAKIEQATTSGGSPADVPGKTITALTQAGSDDNKQAVINFRGDDLTEGYRWVRLTVTVGVATSDMGAVLLGFDPFDAPASDNDSAAVDSIN